ERGTPARRAAMSAEFRGRFDHAVILVADLARASAAFTKLGFSVSPGGAHTGLGTHNALVRFGVDYLELLAIRDEEEALRARGSTAPIVERLRSGRGGLASFALATADIDRDAERFREQGLEALGPFAMERFAVRLFGADGPGWIAERLRAAGEGIFEVTLATTGDSLVIPADAAEGARIAIVSDDQP